MEMQHTAETVLSFWFEEISPKRWWEKSSDFDKLIVQRFAHYIKRPPHVSYFPGVQTARGRLAEILVLDQFSRNIYRDHTLAFANDSLAPALAQTVNDEANADIELDANMRSNQAHAVDCRYL